MKKLLSAVLATIVVAFFTVVTVSPVLAGHRYYGSGYRGHHYHHKHYRHHNYRYYDDSYLWVTLGVGVLTGLIVSAVTAPPPPKTVVYTSSPPVVIHSPPQVIRYQAQSPPLPAPNQVLRQATVNTELLNVRFGPDINSSVIAQLPLGSVVGVIGAAPDWLYIKTLSGQHGWVMSQYIKDSNQHPNTKAPVG